MYLIVGQFDHQIYQNVCFERQTRQCKILNPLAVKRNTVTSIQHEEKLYILGGKDEHQLISNALDILCLQTKSFKKGKSFRFARYNATAITMNDSM